MWFGLWRVNLYLRHQTLIKIQMKHISVIGAGTMGRGIAHVFAQHGFEVVLVDISAEALQKAVANIAQNLDRQIAKGSLQAGDKEATLARLSTTTDMPQGLAKAELVLGRADRALAALDKAIPIARESMGAASVPTLAPTPRPLPNS